MFSSIIPLYYWSRDHSSFDFWATELFDFISKERPQMEREWYRTVEYHRVVVPCHNADLMPWLGFVECQCMCVQRYQPYYIELMKLNSRLSFWCIVLLNLVIVYPVCMTLLTFNNISDPCKTGLLINSNIANIIFVLILVWKSAVNKVFHTIRSEHYIFVGRNTFGETIAAQILRLESLFLYFSSCTSSAWCNTIDVFDLTNPKADKGKGKETIENQENLWASVIISHF